MCVRACASGTGVYTPLKSLPVTGIPSPSYPCSGALPVVAFFAFVAGQHKLGQAWGNSASPISAGLASTSEIGTRDQISALTRPCCGGARREVINMKASVEHNSRKRKRGGGTVGANIHKSAGSRKLYRAFLQARKRPALSIASTCRGVGVIISIRVLQELAGPRRLRGRADLRPCIRPPVWRRYAITPTCAKPCPAKSFLLLALTSR